MPFCVALETEAGILKYEIKICLPIYKICYSICFVVLFSLVRGISYMNEIGISLDVAMSVLAMVFCSDTLQMEYSGKRWEIFCLYPIDSRKKVLYKRILIQCIYLWLLSILGYSCFFGQCPRNLGRVPGIYLFLVFLLAVFISIFFFGMLSFTFANICKNSLAGIAVALLVWQFANSKIGEGLLGNYNIFAFVFCDIQDTTDMGWLLGKGIAILLVMLMAVILPFIIRKRG